MKRKVNRVGLNTLTISLPNKWAQKYSIQKGHELNLVEKDTVLEISPFTLPLGEKVQLNLKEIDKTSLVSILRHHYRNGANTIFLQFNRPDVYHSRLGKSVPFLDVVQQEKLRLMGMEIIEQKASSCLLRCMVQENKENFDIFLRKIFLLIKNSLAELALYFKDGDKERLRLVQSNHDSLTLFISYNIRILNRFGYNNIQHCFSLRTILESLEMVMDINQRATHKLDLALTQTEFKASHNSFNWINDLKSYFEDFTTFYYTLNFNLIKPLDQKRIELEHQLLSADFPVNEKPTLQYLSASLLLLKNIIGLKAVIES